MDLQAIGAVRETGTVADRALGQDPHIIEGFMGRWLTFTQLPPNSRARAGMMRFLAAETAEERTRGIATASTLFKLHLHYQQLGILRADLLADPFNKLLGMTREAMAAAIRQGDTLHLQALLERVFEFGRYPVSPQHHAVRNFLLEVWQLQPGGPGLAYQIHAHGIPTSICAKNPDEPTRRSPVAGLTLGAPQCGGQLRRNGPLTFAYDVRAQAAGNPMTHGGVGEILLRWLRGTGGDAQQVTLRHEPNPTSN